MRRRAEQSEIRQDIEFFKEPPTFAEIKDALRSVRESHLDIVRLAALMDNLAIYHQFRVESVGKDYRGHTSGIRKFLSKDGYLRSRYDTLMRYRRLGAAIRKAAGVPDETNLLWGLVPTFPTDETDDLYWHEAEWQTLHDLYASLKGMNFKQINDKLKG